mmetsp:Transcript_4735/g.11638  ORF Transcript_4735/g.11638 Transcript_4735/m.11638 type:complete len:273 (-) Transcript_4735:14-832(-)
MPLYIHFRVLLDVHHVTLFAARVFRAVDVANGHQILVRVEVLAPPGLRVAAVVRHTLRPAHLFDPCVRLFRVPVIQHVRDDDPPASHADHKVHSKLRLLLGVDVLKYRIAHDHVPRIGSHGAQAVGEKPHAEVLPIFRRRQLVLDEFDGFFGSVHPSDGDFSQPHPLLDRPQKRQHATTRLENAVAGTDLSLNGVLHVVVPDLFFGEVDPARDLVEVSEFRLPRQHVERLGDPVGVSDSCLVRRGSTSSSTCTRADGRRLTFGSGRDDCTRR